MKLTTVQNLCENPALCSVLYGRKHDFTACKLVKNGLTGGIYHS